MVYNNITINCVIGNFSRNGGSAGSTNVEKPLSRGFDVNSLIGNTDDKDDDRDRGSPGSRGMEERYHRLIKALLGVK